MARVFPMYSFEVTWCDKINENIQIGDSKMVSELDLHGVRHPDVKRRVENFVLLHKTPMNIITGRSEKMIWLTTNVLKKYRFKYVIYSHNPGMIIVLEGEINAD